MREIRDASHASKSHISAGITGERGDGGIDLKDERSPPSPNPSSDTFRHLLRAMVSLDPFRVKQGMGPVTSPGCADLVILYYTSR